MNEKRQNIVNEVSALDRRVSSSSVAKRLVRKRFLQAGGGGVDRYQMDGVNAVYFNQRQPPVYVKCAFLDHGDTVLAASATGYIDIVRVPRYGGMSPRPLGRALCTNLSLSLDRSSGESECTKLHGFRNGEAFAAGLGNGEFQIFSTERQTPWWVSKQKQLGLLKTHKAPVQEFITHAYKVSAPSRRHYNFTNVPLVDQLRNPFYLAPLAPTHGYHDVEKASWDFREISSGSIQAVHVGAYGKSFCFRLLDSRTPRSQHDICVDLHRANQFSFCACFLSDNAVATSDLLKIKIWDLRMIQKGGSNQLSPFWPTLPDDVAHELAVDNCSSIDIDWNKFFSDIEYSQSGMNPKLEISKRGISDLTLLNSGHFVASSSESYHVVVDPIKMTAISAVNTNKTQYGSIAPPDHSNDLDLRSYAIDRQNGYIVRHDNGTDDYGSAGSLYFFDSMSSKKGTTAGKKRKVVSDTSDGSILGENFDFKIDAAVQDQNGLRSDLSHMSFNDLGSSLVATTLDGGIFLWSAS